MSLKLRLLPAFVSSNRIRGLTSPQCWQLIFLLCALPTGLGVALLTPIGEMPDEPQHIERADGLLSMQIVGHHQLGTSAVGVTMNVALFEAMIAEIVPTIPGRPLPDAARRQARAVKWSDGTLFCPTQMVEYFPTFYLPAAFGIVLGQTLRIAPLYTLFLSRITMLLSFLAMGTAALRLAQHGRPLLFTVLCLPMTIYLSASFNQDGQLIAAAALAAALLTRRDEGPNRPWFIALLLLTLIACAKPPYAWLLLACLLPLAGPDLRRRAGWVAAALLLPALWLYSVQALHVLSWNVPPYHPGPLWSGSHAGWLTSTDAHDNLLVLLTHPSQLILLPLRSLWAHWPTIWPRMIGAIGWDFLPIAHWQAIGWLIALAATLLGTAVTEHGSWRAGDAGFILLLIFGSFITVELALYLSYTKVGAPVIEGVNGRYFLLFPPFVILALPRLGGWLDRTGIFREIAFLPIAVCYLPAVAMAVLDMYLLPRFISSVYRMSGP